MAPVPRPRHRHRRRRPDRLLAAVPHRLGPAARPRPARRAAPARDRAGHEGARGRRHGARRLRLPAAGRHRGHLRPQDRLRRDVLGAARRLRSRARPAWSAATCSASTAASSSRRARPSPRTPPSDVRVLVVGNPCNTNCLIARSQRARGARRPLVRHDPPRPEPGQDPAGRARPASPVADGRPTSPSGATTPRRSSPTSPTPRSAASRRAEVIGDDEWLQGDFITTVQKRGRRDHRGPRLVVGGLGRQRGDRHRRRAAHADARGRLRLGRRDQHGRVRRAGGPPVRLPGASPTARALVGGRGLRPRRLRHASASGSPPTSSLAERDEVKALGLI